ncbi:hypothetical protein CB1_000622027 [Camelus ferus]|nr:hypothetical protein CB1_000622027 [Camelus ferus]
MTNTSPSSSALALQLHQQRGEKPGDPARPFSARWHQTKEAADPLTSPVSGSGCLEIAAGRMAGLGTGEENVDWVGTRKRAPQRANVMALSSLLALDTSMQHLLGGLSSDPPKLPTLVSPSGPLIGKGQICA